MEFLTQIKEFNILDLGMIFGPVLAYIPQFRLIKKNKTIGNFSLWICFILIFGNILRIFFWIGVKFKIVLLIQSFLMIICQIILLKTALDSSKIEFLPLFKDKNKYWANSFWKWDEPRRYYETIVFFTCFTSIITFFLINSSYFLQTIGFLALLIESLLPVPQFLANRKNKSTEGLSCFLIICWFLGDCFKTWYYIDNSQPMQFILCGFLQLIFDSLILLQIQAY